MPVVCACSSAPITVVSYSLLLCCFCQLWVQCVYSGTAQEDTWCCCEEWRRTAVQTQSATGQGKDPDTFTIPTSSHFCWSLDFYGGLQMSLSQALVDLASEDISKGWTQWYDSHSFILSLLYMCFYLIIKVSFFYQVSTDWGWIKEDNSDVVVRARRQERMKRADNWDMSQPAQDNIESLVAEEQRWTN